MSFVRNVRLFSEERFAFLPRDYVDSVLCSWQYYGEITSCLLSVTDYTT